MSFQAQCTGCARISWQLGGLGQPGWGRSGNLFVCLERQAECRISVLLSLIIVLSLGIFPMFLHCFCLLFHFQAYGLRFVHLSHHPRSHDEKLFCFGKKWGLYHSIRWNFKSMSTSLAQPSESVVRKNGYLGQSSLCTSLHHERPPQIKQIILRHLARPALSSPHPS